MFSGIFPGCTGFLGSGEVVKMVGAKAGVEIVRGEVAGAGDGELCGLIGAEVDEVVGIAGVRVAIEGQPGPEGGLFA